VAEVGYASLGIIPSFKGFGSELEKGSAKHLSAAGDSGGTVFGDAAGKSAGKRFGGIFKTAAKSALVGLAGAGALAFKIGKDAVGAASDLNETISKTEQIFGAKAIPALEKFADAADTSMGQSKQASLDAIATFGIMGKVAGLEGPKLGKFSTKLTTLASDMASFGNTSPEEAVLAIGSALRGEAEPIRKYGVLLDDATLKAEAMALGILKPIKDEAKIKSYHAKVLEGQVKYNEAVAEFGPKSLEAIKAEASLGSAQSSLAKATEGTIPTLTAQQKVLAAQSAIFKQTSDQQGDFTRTSGGLANQQRILAAGFENAKAKLGVGLLPIVTDATTFLVEKGVPAFERFSEWFNKKGIPAISNFADDARPLVNEILPAMGTTLGTIRDVLKPAAGHAKDLVSAFNDMPAWAKTAIVGGGASLFVGRKLGLGKVAGKAAGSLVGSAKPIPVFVVNEGFGGAGGGSGKAGWLKSVAKWGGPAAVVAGGVAAAEFSSSRHPDRFAANANKEGALGGFGGIGAAAEDFGNLKGSIDSATGSASAFTEEIFGVKRPVTDAKVLIDDTGRVTRQLNRAIENIPKPRIDSSEILTALGAAEKLAQALRDITKASAGFDTKLKGDSYGGGNGVVMNFNGVDLPAAKREMSHLQRAAAIGGADFT
jgi:hypothetical protein